MTGYGKINGRTVFVFSQVCLILDVVGQIVGCWGAHKEVVFLR